MKKINLYKQYKQTNKRRTTISFTQWAAIYIIALCLGVMGIYMKERVQNSV